MIRPQAFSLAEALITLLIVCIIAIATVPVITKKSRPNPSKVIWVADTMVKTAVTPSAQRDIKLGDATGHVKQGIVITGTMYFKDRNGKVIGWISEDGNTSFAQGNDYDFNAMSQRQEMLMNMLQNLTAQLNNVKNPSDYSNTDSSAGSSQRLSKIRKARESRQKNRLRNDYSDNSSRHTVETDTEQIQQQLNSLMELLNTQQR
ncbi:TPA: hypothetical protein CPT85_06310 [Candidatus Gastranaerophilales bacterium HUM_21]|nr:MAG TPA: hypothetical protein CPT85_06310 [Candidatus Gastranaerophilales bacterium HUM_21]